MVQNAGIFLKNRRNERRERVEKVAISLFFSLYFR